MQCWQPKADPQKPRTTWDEVEQFAQEGILPESLTRRRGGMKYRKTYENSRKVATSIKSEIREVPETKKNQGYRRWSRTIED